MREVQVVSLARIKNAHSSLAEDSGVVSGKRKAEEQTEPRRQERGHSKMVAHTDFAFRYFWIRSLALMTKKESLEQILGSTSNCQSE